MGYVWAAIKAVWPKNQEDLEELELTEFVSAEAFIAQVYGVNLAAYRAWPQIPPDAVEDLGRDLEGQISEWLAPMATRWGEAYYAQLSGLAVQAINEEWSRERFERAVTRLALAAGGPLAGTEEDDTGFKWSWIGVWYNMVASASFNQTVLDKFSSPPTNRLYPYITRVSQRDEKVRPAHAHIDGFTARSTWKGWLGVTPPDGWNCRCYLVASGWDIARAAGWDTDFPEGSRHKLNTWDGPDPGFEKPSIGGVPDPDFSTVRIEIVGPETLEPGALWAGRFQLFGQLTGPATVAVDWGDNSFDSYEGINTRDTVIEHTFKTPGNRVINAWIASEVGIPETKFDLVVIEEATQPKKPPGRFPISVTGFTRGQATEKAIGGIFVESPAGERGDAVVDWGDGEGETVLNVRGMQWRGLAHEWKEPGDYTIKITWDAWPEEETGATAAGTHKISIAAEPKWKGVSIRLKGLQNAKVGKKVRGEFIINSIKDLNGVDVFLDWGDGGFKTYVRDYVAAIHSDLVTEIDHTYTEKGDYKVRVWIAESSGPEDIKEVPVTEIVKPPFEGKRGEDVRRELEELKVAREKVEEEIRELFEEKDAAWELFNEAIENTKDGMEIDKLSKDIRAFDDAWWEKKHVADVKRTGLGGSAGELLLSDDLIDLDHKMTTTLKKHKLRREAIEKGMEWIRGAWQRPIPEEFENQPADFTATRKRRGFHRGAGLRFGEGDQAFDVVGSEPGTVHMPKRHWNHTKLVIHEMGHWLEAADQEAHELTMEFLRERTKDSPLELMGLGFDRDEETRPDKFRDRYIGKNYGDRASEVLSMGLEMMYLDPEAFAAEDPEMFDFIYDLMKGAI